MGIAIRMGLTGQRAGGGYRAPEWDATLARLPDYATSHHFLSSVSDTANWSLRAPAAGASWGFDDRFGFPAVRLRNEGPANNPIVQYMHGAAVGTNAYLVYRLASEDWAAIDSQAHVIMLFNAAGTQLFERRVSWSGALAFRGENQRQTYKAAGVERFEVPTSSFVPVIGGANLADVAGVGLRLERKTAAPVEVWWGDVHAVNFRPMITLRFDDQRASVYNEAYPLLQAKGFPALMSVITGAQNLANSPDLALNLSSMTKAQLLEIQDDGWDLVAHTHTHRVMTSLAEAQVTDDLRLCRNYLRDELGSSLVARSTVVWPQNTANEMTIRAARSTGYDISVRKFHINSAMPRQPEGDWDNGSLWMAMGSGVGDGRTSAQLIALAQAAINNQRWQTVQLHDVRADTATVGLNVNPSDFGPFVDWLDANRALIDVVSLSEAVNRIAGPTP